MSEEVLDLRGVKCPMNLVKTKLKLESMNKGDVLDIYLSDPAAKKDVPLSLEHEEHEILDIKEIMEENFFIIKVKN